MKNPLLLLFFLFILNSSFAGWSEKGTKFHKFDGASKTISCKYNMSGNGFGKNESILNISVWFEITDTKNGNSERLNLFSWSQKKDSLSIKTTTDIPINGCFKDNLFVFYDKNNNVKALNLDTKQIIWVGNNWNGIIDVKMSDSLTYVAFKNGDLRLSKNLSGKKIRTLRISSSIKKLELNSNHNLLSVIDNNDKAFIYNLKDLSLIDSIENCIKIIFPTSNEIIYESYNRDLILYELNKKKKLKTFSNKKLKNIGIVALEECSDNFFAIELKEDFNFNKILILNKLSGYPVFEKITNKPKNNYNGPNLLGFQNNNLILNSTDYGENKPFALDVKEIIGLPQDLNGPEIKITFPKPSNTEKSITYDEFLSIKGIAVDSSEIKSVFINEIAIPFLPKSGEFNGYIKLNDGENFINIKAIDLYNNVSQSNFKVFKTSKSSRGARPINSKNEINPLKKYSYHALIIAEQDYEDVKIKDLSHPILDAKNLKDILIEHYSFDSKNIQLKLNPKRNEIMQSLDSLLYKLTSQDHLLIFFAGHGVYDEKLKRGYWLPSDAKKNNKANWVSNNDIRDYISAIETKHTLLITDACFSGSIFEYNRNIEKEQNKILKTLLDKKSRTAMTSGLDKVVPDKSVFLQYFLKYLIENPKPYITAKELFNELYDVVISNTDNNPQYGVIKNSNHEGGEFVFLRRE